MKYSRGISISGIIVLIGVMALIAWGLYYIVENTQEGLVPIDQTTQKQSPTPRQTTQQETRTQNTTATSTATSTTNTKTTSQATSTTAKTYTVTYTNSGYSPKTLTINKGDTVQFVNKSSINMWTASDPHPAHTLYPEFDQKKSSATFNFTFTKIGTWGYHNHVNTAATGTIMVK